MPLPHRVLAPALVSLLAAAGLAATAAPATAELPSNCVVTDGKATCTYTRAGGDAVLTLPYGSSQYAQLTVVGAAGANNSGGYYGGLPAYLAGQHVVAAGKEIRIDFRDDGGTGGVNAGAGGGSTRVDLADPGAETGTLMAWAAGGGGAGGGGNGTGGHAGMAGTSTPTATGGGAATDTAGGTGGSPDGAAGAAGQGGAGASSSTPGGGGGGGGFFGGGGGGAGTTGAGGGGGSSKAGAGFAVFATGPAGRNDTAKVVVKFDYSATPATPTLVFGPSPADLGAVTIGSAAAGEIGVRNNSGFPVDVSGVSVTGADAGAFVPSEYDDCIGTLAPNATCTVRVTFTPQRVGAHAADLSVASSGSDSPNTSALLGSGKSNADLDILGPGTVYTDGNGNRVTLAVAPSGTAVYKFKVTNSGPYQRAFKIGLANAGSPATTHVLLPGALSDLPKATDGTWVTPGIPAGTSKEFQLKVDPTGTGQPTARLTLSLMAANLAVFDTGLFDANTQAPAAGVDAFGIFARAGSQPFVGGGAIQITTAPSLAATQTSPYTIRLRNDAAVAAPIKVRLAGTSSECWTLKVTAPNGLTRVDITSAIFGAGWTSAKLSPHTQVDLQATVTRVKDGCGPAQWTASTYEGETAKRHVVLLANPKVGTF